MLRMIIVFMMICFSGSLAQAKVIFVGAHGGPNTYFDLWEDDDGYNPLKAIRFNSGEAVEVEVSKDDDIETVRDVADSDSGGHGVDASIAFVRINSDVEITARISRDAANTSEMKKRIVEKYEEGDFVFLVGYSSGGKFVMNLSDDLEGAGKNGEDIPVHFLGLIDPIVGFNITIPKNVEKAVLYVQDSEEFDFQGFPFFFHGKSTEYVTLTVSGDSVNHMSIDNQEIVWGHLGDQMLLAIGETSDKNTESGSTSIEDGNTVKESVDKDEEESKYIDEDGDGFYTIHINKLPADCNDNDSTIHPFSSDPCKDCDDSTICSSDTSDSNSETEDTGTPDPTPDINVHIDKVTASYQGRENYEHETNIYLGQEARMEVDIENKGDEDIYVDIEYFLDDDKNFSFDDSHKVGEDNHVKIEHGTRDNGQPENVIEHKQHIYFSEVGTHYLYVRVTTNGDSDESGSSNTRDYAKVIVNEPVEIPVQNTEPTGKSWEELTPGEKAAILQIILG